MTERRQDQEPSPFTKGASPAPRGFFAKMLLQSKPTDAERTIMNRLAGGPISEVTAEAIGEDLRGFGVTGKAARQVVASIWRTAVTAFLADDTITNDEAKYLAELRCVLGLSDAELKAAEEELVHTRFGREVDLVIGDDHLSASDRRKLDGLAEAIRLPKDVADRILLKSQENRLSVAARNAIADERLSPAELADLHALARSLDVELRLDQQTQAMFDRYALLWRIENGELPALGVPINLQRGEICHAVADTVWMEMRTRTDRINYGGPVASIRICKGLRYRVGSVRVQRITREELTEVDRGRLYLTNKRVIFDGGKKNTAIRLSALLSFTPFADGVVLEKSSGRAPHLLLTGDVEVFLAVLGAVLASSE
jgi:hypothetical protein